MSWKVENNKLQKHFEFRNFVEAFRFLSGVALLAEKVQHHPEIHNVYNKVNISLQTHDAGDTVTDKDRELAKLIDTLV